MSVMSTNVSDVLPANETSEGNQNEKSTLKPHRDLSRFSLVEAAQYGILERCIELVERGENVCRGDEENITVLHWAAINNRLEIASYFIQQGADVNAVGGELKGSPLHWATRQGHLSMVIVLMRYGSNPYILDGEGVNCLHIAAQLGFTDITAYYIAKGMEIDVKDGNGLTPLMHTAMRSYNHDPARLLVNMKASVTETDMDGNTALHHAAMSNNSTVVKILIDENASVGVTNRVGKTPCVIAQEQRNKYILDILTREEDRKSPKSFFNYLLRDRRASWWIMFLIPTVFFFLFGMLGVYSPAWYYYMLGFGVLGFILQVLIRLYIPGNANTPLPFGLVFATKFWLYLTSITVAFPLGVIHHIWVFSLLTTSMFYFYWKTMVSDPGFVAKAPSIAQAKQKILELCEIGSFDNSRFCTTCLIRRPVRSKHCFVCKRCVAKFDHHCMWTYNCVGWKNHVVFMGYLLTLQLLLLWGLTASLSGILVMCSHVEGSFWSRIGQYMSCSPWVSWIAVNCVVHFTWVNLLFIAQCMQIFVQASTTNERMNAFRYPHFKKQGGSSPFNRGILVNISDFFGCRCHGNQPPPSDWTTCYLIPGEEENQHEKAKQTIPLPYSNANSYHHSM